MSSKICRKCGSDGPWLYKRGCCDDCERQRARDWHKNNREKSREIAKRYKSNNPDKVAAYNASAAKAASQRKYDLRTRFGITPEQYDEMLEAVGGQCPVCGHRPTDDEHRLAVDHNHTTGEIRGLLCKPCNLALGNLGDDPNRIRALARYIEGR